jgi:ubiquitin-protein ligase
MSWVQVIKKNLRGPQKTRGYVAKQVTREVTELTAPPSSQFGTLSYIQALKCNKTPIVAKRKVTEVVYELEPLVTGEESDCEYQVQREKICLPEITFPQHSKVRPIQNNSELIVQVRSPISLPQIKLPTNMKVVSHIISYSLLSHKRVIKEALEVNADFHNLRTIICEDPAGHINTLYYLMLPNDGAFCHLPLLGRIIIPFNYPKVPPIFHMLTITGRANVDIFHYYASSNLPHSSMCFDIFKDPYDYSNASTWKPTYTISTIVASLLQSLVSYMVPQMGGGYEHPEAVTMEQLKACYENSIKTLEAYVNYVPEIPSLPGIRAFQIPNITPIQFPQQIFANSDKPFFHQLIISPPMFLQSHKSYSVGFDLSGLTDNYVCSFVLTNNPRDLEGRNPKTILFRNGVTATAARKTPLHNKTTWFYHGKPLNLGHMKFAITITSNQMTCSYQDETTGGVWVVHGDCALSRLDKEIVGSLKNQTFFLVVYLKRKSGSNGITLRNLNLDCGYIHPNTCPL